MSHTLPSLKHDLVEWVIDARRRTLALLEDLSDAQLRVPSLETLNPPLWEAGHVAWFQEKWVLRHAAGAEPLQSDADALYDSAATAHERRWSLPLPGRRETIGYLTHVRDRVLETLERRPADPDVAYHTAYSVFHEDMHAEAAAYTRQTLAYPPPCLPSGRPACDSANAARGCISPGAHRLEGPGGTASNAVRVPGESGERDVRIAGGRFLLGATTDEPLVFDNEKWAHGVSVLPFAISRRAVTQGEFAEFVAAGGYRHDEFWSQAGWQWRVRAEAEHPAYWRRGGNAGWERRHFDQWLPIEPEHPVIHVNWYEAEAWCRWARRRLPTEAEWEFAAAAGSTDAPAKRDHSDRAESRALSLSGGPATATYADGTAETSSKRRYPWGDQPATSERANLDGDRMGTLAVDALPCGDSAAGCRQMIGNVWEWTASDFLPYPGFVPDPYEEYSRPWFGNRKVLRGGAWATRSRLIRNTYRNFYVPDRRDVFAGFRTCAVRE